MGSLAGRFPTTRLSVIVEAHAGDDQERRQAWNAVIAAYWKPAYKHVRLRWSKGPADAADLAQAFFERAMARDFFAGYEPERARFRTFFRVCLDRFVSNEIRDAAREKRGG